MPNPSPLSGELERLRAEQLQVAAFLQEHPEDRGARLELSDLLFEELILTGVFQFGKQE